MELDWELELELEWERGLKDTTRWAGGGVAGPSVRHKRAGFSLTRDTDMDP